MLIFKILLITLLALLILAFILLLLPVSVAIKFKNKFIVRVYYCGFKIFSSEKSKTQKSKEEKKDAPDKSKKNPFKAVYEQKGLKGSIDYFSGLLSILLGKLLFVIKHIKIKKLRFNLWVTGPDAAQTAIRYGEVCTAIYPVFSALSAVTDCNIKKINVNADFNSQKNRLKFSFVIRSLPVFLIIAAIGGFMEYKKYKGVNLNE